MRNICILQNYFFPTPKHALKTMNHKGNSKPQLVHKLTLIFTKSLKKKKKKIFPRGKLVHFNLSNDLLVYSFYKVCLPKFQSTVSSGPTSRITVNTNLKEDHSFILKENKCKVIALLSSIIQTKSHVEDFWNVPCRLGGRVRIENCIQETQTWL